MVSLNGSVATMDAFAKPSLEGAAAAAVDGSAIASSDRKVARAMRCRDIRGSFFGFPVHTFARVSNPGLTAARRDTKGGGHQ